MEIRKAELNDLDEVLEVLNELYHGEIQYDIFSKLYKERIDNENSCYIVAIDGDKIVGVLISEITHQLHRTKKSSFIEDLVVREEYRNKGIGKQLVEAAIKYAKQLECEVIELTSYITNEKAHRFYERNGFEKHSYKFKQYLK